MDTSKITPQLNQFLTTLSQTITVDELIVFGSYAKGTATKHSDIDVVVVSDDFNKLEAKDWLKVVDKASEGITPEIQAWPFTKEQIQNAGELTTLGQARTAGVRFV